MIAMGKPPGNSLPFLFKLAMVFRQLKPAVIHTRNWGGIDGVFAARLAGIKSIVHGEHGWGMADPFGMSVRRRYIRRVADFGIHRYTCVSKQMEDWLVNHIRVNKPIKQIYNGIDTSKFRPVTADEKARLPRMLGLPENTPFVGVVGRLDPIKDHACLFKAFQMLKTVFPKVQLLVVGDGPERERLEKISVEGIRFLGRRDDIDQILPTLDVFVLPSKNEGISNTVLEAMACGLPVVASRVGGNPELIDNNENGMLFPSGDSETLAAIVQSYLQYPEIAKDHGKMARKSVISRFRTRDMVCAYERVWRKTWFDFFGKD